MLQRCRPVDLMVTLARVCISSPSFDVHGFTDDCPFADEILLSNDKTIAVIDGSGVLADPAGINREELVRLAKLRIPVSNFNKAKLSKDGYLVKVEDQDVKMPCTLTVLSFSCNELLTHLFDFRLQLVKSLSTAPISGTART